ncbi:MAG: hypothetical protein JWN72_2248, partial [Thermoleophilia bacterium]|nr:hypothetical protein [Thermoleophilia bacterium]
LNGEDQAHAAWEAEVERIDAANALLEINELDPTKDPLATNAMAYTRGNEGVLSGETVNGTLAAPLQPSGAGSTVFDVPGELAAQANAATLDQSAPATDPAAYAQLNEEQATYEAQVAAATTDGERAAVMSAYFADHPYWIDRGTEDSGDVLMASAWSQGAPASEMFGSSRATDPHATMARTGIAGLDDQGNQASVDVVQNRYVDGSIDDIVRTQYEGLAGASRTTVTSEYSTAAGTVIERNQTAESTQPRVDEGKEPLSVTEVVNERFDPVTGLPSGEQYSAVATSDSTTTSLRETRDQYDATGVIYDTTIDTTDMTRNYDADVTADFLAENRRILELGGSSTDGENDLDVNRDGTSITTPPAGSSYAHSHTDVDYDTAGVAIHRTVVEDATSVTSTDGDTNGNGVHITDSHTERELGAAGGTTPIFDAAGANAVGETAVTTVETSDFDPDAGQAGGYNDSSHQYRASSSITLGRTTAPDNTVSGEWATPLTTRELREGHDDDWVFTERHLQTEVDGQPTLEGEGDEAHPIELEAGASITDAHGNATTLANGTTKRESLDFSDNFEAFMEDWGGKAIAIGAIAAGILAVPLSGGASLALTVVGVGLAATSFAYTAINYDQGEASGWDLAIAGAGTALAFLPAINGLRTLGSASRLTSVGGGMVDDAMRAPALVRAATSSAANSTLRVGNVANVAMTGNDVWDAGRQALQGDFAGAGMLLLAAAGGKVASRIRVPRVANGVTGGGADGGGTETSPTPAIDTAATTTTPPVQPIAPSTIPTRVPLAGSNTSGAAAAPLTGSTTPGAAAAAASLPAPAATTTAVGGARGGGASSSVVDVDFTNNASFYSNGNRGAANDPNVPKVVPGTTEGSLTGHVGNQHATALEQVDAAYPRMTANRPENIPGFSVGADGVPPIGTIVRTGAGSKLQYSMVVDASGTMRPVTSQGAAAPAAESTYAEVRAANDAVQGVEKWQVPKHQYAPDLADSLGQQNPNLQRLVIDGFTNANGRSIIVDRGTTRTVHSDAGRVTGVDAYGNEVTGLRTEWRKLNGVWEPDTAYPAEAPAATVAAPGSINRPNFMWESAPGGTVRTTAVEGVPQFVVGRTSDGSYLLADGAGNRIPASPAYLVSYHADGVLPQGTDLRVGRTSGTVEDGYRVQGNDTDALTLHMAGNGIERPTRTSEVLALNVDRVLGTGEISTPWGPGRILSGPLVTEPGARPAYDVQLHDGGRFRLDGQDLLTANADTVLRRAGVVGTYETTGNAALDAPRPDLMQYARPVPGESIPFGTAVVGGVPRGMSYGFRGGYDFDVNGVTVRIESPASMPNQRVGEQLDAVHRAIQATPADLNAGVQRINVYEGSNPFDPYWSEVRNSPGFHSQATAGGGVVNFWTGLGSMPTDTYQHEVGHIFGADGGPNNTEAWRRAVELDRANRNGISGSNKVKSRTPYFPVLTHDVDGVTGYGDSAITSQGMFTEDFAESVRLQTLSDQQGYIAVGRRRGLLGAVAGRTNYRFEDLFPHRAEALGAFRQLRAAGLDPAGYSPMWAGGPGAAGSSGMPLAATSADANAGVGWISDFNAAAVNTALIAASAGDDE